MYINDCSYIRANNTLCTVANYSCKDFSCERTYMYGKINDQDIAS